MSKQVSIAKEPDRDWTKITKKDAPFEVVSCLYWYRVYATPKQLKRWTLNYVKNNMDKKSAKNYSNGNRSNYEKVGSACRILEKGCPIELVKEIINEGLGEIKRNTVLSRKRSVQAAKTSLSKVKVNPKTKFNNELNEYIHKINSEVDRLINYPKTKKVEWFNAESYFKTKNIKPEFAVEILNQLNPVLNELKLALEGEDEQLVEAYDYLKKRYHTRLIEFVGDIVEVAKKYSNKRTFTKKGKKKRKKSTTPNMMVKKLPHLEKYDELNLISEDPKDIIGATALFVYNVQSRLIYMYIADSKGLSVKGASITGFDKKKSLVKKLRNPKHTMHMVNGKVRLTKKFVVQHIKDIKTVEKPVRERLNKNCIIVRIF
jgi:hypothetical protein